MSLSPTQTKAAQLTTNCPFGFQTDTVICTLDSPSAAGATIVVAATVMVGGGAGGAAGVDSADIIDDQGNVYTPLFFRTSSFEQGPAIGAWICVDAIGGVQDITASFDVNSTNTPINSTDFNQCVVAAEYAMPSSATLQASTYDSNYGATGDVLTLTDSVANTVEVTIVNGDTNWSWSLLDLLFSGNNYLICFGMSSPDGGISPPTVTPVDYGTFTLEQHIVGVSSGGAGGSMYYWDGAELEAVVPPLTLACPVDGGTAAVGVPYSAFLVVAGGVPAYTFAIIGGSLPLGLTLDTATGEISGTPTTAATYTYSAQVTDSLGNTATT